LTRRRGVAEIGAEKAERDLGAPATGKLRERRNLGA